MDKNLTIVLTLKDRCSYTKRFLTYANSINCPFKILIADGGRSKEIEDHLLARYNYPNVDYEYVRYPYDQELSHFHQKLKDLSYRITTPLAVLIDNDDYFLVSSMYKNIEFLRDNPDYTSSRGGLWTIELNSMPCNVKGNMYAKYPDSIVDVTAGGRVLSQSQGFHGNWHNVIRTKHLRASAELLCIADPTNMRFTEQIIGYLHTFWGKSNRDSYPYILHGIGSPSLVPPDHFPGQDVWIRASHWPANFSRMTEVIATAISCYDGTSYEDAADLFLEAYALKAGVVPHMGDLLSQYEKAKRQRKDRRIEKAVLYLGSCNLRENEKIHDHTFKGVSPEEELDIFKSRWRI